MKKTATFFLTSLLAACFGDNSMLSTRGIIAADWAKAPDPYFPDPVYCYKTLGGVDCYNQKISGYEARLVATYPVRPSGVLVQEVIVDESGNNIRHGDQFNRPPQDLITGREIVTPHREVIKVERLEGEALPKSYPTRIDRKPKSLKRPIPLKKP
ncbi:MAG: hypothetical protein ACRYGR_01535 [Janthinobacterium lividum]